jgi:hypothetical protein
MLDVPIEILARNAPNVGIGLEEADRIAALALLIAQERARAAGVVMTPALAVPYAERTPDWRAANRATVVHVVQALVLLGWIEL